MKNKTKLRVISTIFGVGEEDIARTLERFRKEINDMETELRSR